MASLPRDLKHKAVRETERRSCLELLQGRCDDVGILHGEMLVVEQHVDRSRHLRSCDLNGRLAVRQQEIVGDQLPAARCDAHRALAAAHGDP